MRVLNFLLPWPPSVNTYWRNNRGRTHLSAAAKKFQLQAFIAMYEGRPYEPITEQVWVDIELTAPNKRKWDVDNRAKAVLDCLEKSGILENDQQVRHLTIRDSGNIMAPGHAIVYVKPLEAKDQDGSTQQPGNNGQAPGEN